MKINVKIVSTDEFVSFCGIENSVYTVKINNHYKYWYYDLCDMQGFYANTNIELNLEIDDDDYKAAIKLYGSHKYNDRFLRDYEPKVLVHTTTKENIEAILNDGELKCWNKLKRENPDWEDRPIGSLLGDIDDFSNYVMLSSCSWNNEIIVASKQSGVITGDVDKPYIPGARFYLNAEKLANDGLLLRDGQHLKVKNSIPLDKYLIWYCTTDILGSGQIVTPRQFFDLSNEKFFKAHTEFLSEQNSI